MNDLIIKTLPNGLFSVAVCLRFWCFKSIDLANTDDRFNFKVLLFWVDVTLPVMSFKKYNSSSSFKLLSVFNMRLENILRGMTIAGVVSQHHQDKISKQLLPEEKDLFLIHNRVGEIVRLYKLMAAMKGVLLDPKIAEKIKHINQSTIAKAWGVSRLLFPELIQKIKGRCTFKRKKGSGATISVMTAAVKRKLTEILIKHKCDLDFITWHEEISKDKRFKVTPKRETI